VDTRLHSVDVGVERKQFTFDLKENPQGTFLRITETVKSGRRDSIIIPVPGLELFRDALNEVIKFSKTTVEGRATLSADRLTAGKPAPSGIEQT
jgi:PurA ssDNA and RNA-binding protein